MRCSQFDNIMATNPGSLPGRKGQITDGMSSCSSSASGGGCCATTTSRMLLRDDPLLLDEQLRSFCPSFLINNHDGRGFILGYPMKNAIGQQEWDQTTRRMNLQEVEPDPIAPRDQIQIVTAINTVPASLQYELSRFLGIPVKNNNKKEMNTCCEQEEEDATCPSTHHHMTPPAGESGYPSTISLCRGRSWCAQNHLSNGHYTKNPPSVIHHEEPPSSSRHGAVSSSLRLVPDSEASSRVVLPPEGFFSLQTTARILGTPPLLLDLVGTMPKVSSVILTPTSPPPPPPPPDEEKNDTTSTRSSLDNTKTRTSPAPSVNISELQHVKWFQRFTALLEYRMRHGDCNVTPASSLNSPDDAALSLWVKRVRHQYRRYQQGQHSFLTPERVALLQSIGFRWRVHDDSWSDRFKQLQEFARKYGHLRVPVKGPTSGLHNWIKRQRRQYILCEQGRVVSKMTEERRTKLRDLGFFDEQGDSTGYAP